MKELSFHYFVVYYIIKNKAWPSFIDGKIPL